MFNTNDADNFHIKEVETMTAVLYTSDANNFHIKEVETYTAVPSGLTPVMQTIFTSKKWRQ